MPLSLVLLSAIMSDELRAPSAAACWPGWKWRIGCARPQERKRRGDPGYDEANAEKRAKVGDWGLCIGNT